MAEHVVDLEEWEEYDPSKGSFLSHVVAGSAAGVAEHIVMFPVDTYKTHVQFAKGSSSLSFRGLLKTEGFGRMWRGAPAVLLACMPSHAAYFSTYEVCKDKFGVNEPGHHPIAAAAAGAIATTLHDAVLTPFDVVKQRLQLGYYKGIRNCISTMLKQEGPLAFFRSYPTTLLMNMPYAAVVVSTNESLKKVLTPEGEQPSLFTYFLSAAGAGMLAAAATCPLDVVKTRLQTSSLRNLPLSTTAASPTTGLPASGSATQPKAHHFSSSPVQEARQSVWRSLLPLRAQVAMLYTSPSMQMGAFALAKQIFREEGAAAFFKGVRARMAFHAPSSAISWGTYEIVKKLINS